jgi:HEAT repeat protein
VLDAALASRDPEEHGEALAALGASGRSDALARLSEAITAEDGKVRFAGARGLAYLRDHRGAMAIAAAYRKEKGWAVRKELARAAAACAARDLVPDLREALRDPHREVAVAAAFSLHDLGDKTGTEALARLGNPQRKDILGDGARSWSQKVLGGEKPGDRALAARTLARIGTAEDVGLLEPHLTATSSDERVWAAAAIIRLSPRRLP